MKKFILDLISNGDYLFVDRGQLSSNGCTPYLLVEYMLITKALEEAKGVNTKIVKEVQKMTSKMTMDEILEDCDVLAKKILNMLED